jgi:formate hydrogenlyase transcriptional activator
MNKNLFRTIDFIRFSGNYTRYPRKKVTAKILCFFTVNIAKYYMESLQIIIVLLSSGIALTMGLGSLITGLNERRRKADLLFGIICITIFLFFVFPPLGFILVDNAPHASNILIKRVFNLLFFSLFPWFVFFYTGYKKRIFPLIIDGLFLSSFLIMTLSDRDIYTSIWRAMALLAIGLSNVHGTIAIRYQFRFGEKAKAKWFQSAFIIFPFLFLLAAIGQIWNEFFSTLLHTPVFLPINVFPLAFILLMCFRLRANVLESSRLERALGSMNLQWDSLLRNIELIIVQTDNSGKVKYINPYGVSLLQCRDASEIIGKYWLDYFMPGPETGIITEFFKKVFAYAQNRFHYKNSILTKGGMEKTIIWTNEIIYSEEGKVNGLMSIGSDITDQELAFQKIRELKSELEKENLMQKNEPVPEWMRDEIIGKSQAITYAIQKASKVALSQASVLLEGETGVGKELFAELIQRISLRRNKPFIKVNCSALPAELIEDELFGHERGAFTGASQARKGRFEIADGGTIFLDEIGELPLLLQPKLLRVLQNGEFERVGGQQTIKVDVRVIAATNRDLELEVKKGKFRDDLFYRLNVFPITIPPLRNRKEDIPMLIQFFIDKESKIHGKTFESISKSDMNNLCEFEWLGNIRELKNVIERSVIASETHILRLEWFYQSFKEKNHSSSHSSLEQIEKEYILKVLQESQWRISGEQGAAEKLVMHPNTLRSRMKKLNINRYPNA